MIQIECRITVNLKDLYKYKIEELLERTMILNYTLNKYSVFLRASMNYKLNIDDNKTVVRF